MPVESGRATMGGNHHDWGFAMSTIVLALDGSEGSDRAIPVAVNFARRDGARVVVAHARTHALETGIEATLHARVDAIASSGVECSLSIRDSLMGDESKVIAEIAEKEEAELIVIASRGRGPFKGAVLGSTTQRLLPVAACPVLVVPGGFVAQRIETADQVAAEA
jgi:nucleotide-binding universal stress UspA family protein